MSIINKIKALRLQRNVSQAEMSDILALGSVGQIGNIESSKFKHKYTLQQLNQIATFFNVSVSTFFLEEDEFTPDSQSNIQLLIERIIAYQN